MEPFADIVTFLAGTPAVLGPLLTAMLIFLTSDWRLALGALLAQYALIGLALTRFVPPEVVVVKILVGLLVALMLYLAARRVQEVHTREYANVETNRFPAFQGSWLGGTLGLSLRLLCVLLVSLALIRLFQDLRFSIVPLALALVACWLGGMGVIGLVLGGGPLRMAVAFMTILSGFDLVYSALEPKLVVVGFLGAFALLASLAFSYLAVVQGLSVGSLLPEETEQ